MHAGAEEPARPKGIFLHSPVPELKWETWKELLRETGKPESEIRCRVKMVVRHGEVESVAMAQSSGFKSADGEIREWVQKAWHFKPEINGEYVLPVNLRLPKAVPAVISLGARRARPQARSAARSYLG